MGFEDNTTFMVVNRDWEGVPITLNKTVGGVSTLSIGVPRTVACDAVLTKACGAYRQSSGTCLDCLGLNSAALQKANCTTGAGTIAWCPGMPPGEFIVTIEQLVTPSGPPPAPPSPPAPMCTAHSDTDIGGPRIASCPESKPSCLPAAATQQQCCDGCTKEKTCKAWVYAPAKQRKVGAGSCWLMAEGGAPKKHSNRVSGGAFGSPGSGPSKPTHIKVRVEVTDVAYQGTTVLWEIDDLDSVSQNLNWPPPITAGDKPQSYAIKDYPRFCNLTNNPHHDFQRCC